MLKRRRWLLVGLLAVIVLAVAGFVAWGSIVPPPMPQAMAELESDDQIQVEIEPWLVFRPAGSEPQAGLILYPGRRVDPRAYAPIAREIASQGYLVAIVPMPLNLAVFGAERAREVMAAYPEVKSWAMGGHSLGGAMAARFAYEHVDRVDGLVLWAAYPAESNDLVDRELPVVSIYGSLDGLATPDKIESSRALLPAETRCVWIEGGNHAQFGWYRPQAGDKPATISREEQQAQVVDATVKLLDSIPSNQ